MEFAKVANMYNGAVKTKAELERIVFKAFIDVTEHINYQMKTLNQVVENNELASFSEDEVKTLTDSLKAFFSRDASLLRSIMFFSLSFSCINVDITWLDEIAEGLKHVIFAVNGALLNLKRVRINANADLDMSANNLVVYLQSSLRQITYTLGWVAGRLI